MWSIKGFLRCAKATLARGPWTESIPGCPQCFGSLNALGLLRASENPWEALRPKCVILMEEIFVSAWSSTLCREIQRPARGIVPPQFHWLHLWHIPGWTPENPGSYVQYLSINIYNLVDVEMSWILYEEGMLPLLPTLSHFPLLTTLQLSWYALECSAIKCANYIVKIVTNYQSYQLVFVNESSCDRWTTYRNHAWAGGEQFKKPFL